MSLNTTVGLKLTTLAMTLLVLASLAWPALAQAAQLLG